MVFYYQLYIIFGVIYVIDFDMGVVGEVYYDKVVVNYYVFIGNYMAWNNGWVY